MNKRQIKSLVQDHIHIILDRTEEIHTIVWARAKAVYEMKEMVNWRKSPYKSFGAFVKQELPTVNYTTMLTEQTGYRKLIKLGYTISQITTIGNSVSFNKARLYAMTLTERVDIRTFIRNAKMFKPSDMTSFIEHPNRIQMWITDDHMAKFERLLAPYGMHRTNTDRKGKVSQAFMDYLDTLEV